jgi:hypothetical protein
VLAPPRPPSPPDELDLLIREARARQRKRWLLAGAVTAAVVGVLLGASAILSGQPGGSVAGDRPHGVAATRQCAATQLRLGRPRFDGAYTAHVIENLTLTNVSGRSCALRGWPAFEVSLPGGRLVSAHVGHVRNATSSRVVPNHPVTLRAGGSASFHAVENDGTGLEDICPVPLPSARVLVIPPGSSAPAHGSVPMPYCHTPRRLGVFVSPLVAGRLDKYIFQ